MSTELTNDFIEKALTTRGGFDVGGLINELRAILSLDPTNPKRARLINDLFADQDETRAGIEAEVEAGKMQREEVPTDIVERLAKAAQLKEMLLRGEGTKELGSWMRKTRVDTQALLDQTEEISDELDDKMAARADLERENERRNKEPIVPIPED